MKTNMTHKILMAVSKEASKRGYTTTLTYRYDQWWLDVSSGEYVNKIIKRTSSIGALEDWMSEQEASQKAPTE